MNNKIDKLTTLALVLELQLKELEELVSKASKPEKKKLELLQQQLLALSNLAYKILKSYQ